MPENTGHTDDKETKHNPEKANKHSKTKLPWFSHLLWHSAKKRGGLILQHSWVHMGHVPLDILSVISEKIKFPANLLMVQNAWPSHPITWLILTNKT